MTMEFDPALGTHGRITLTSRTGSHTGSAHDSFTLDLANSQSAWRYFYAFGGGFENTSGSAITGDFDLETMQIENFTVPNSATLPDAADHQDFADSTEVDPDADLTVSSTNITVTDAPINNTSYVHKTVPSTVDADWDGYYKISVNIDLQLYFGFFFGLVESTAGNRADILTNVESAFLLGVRAGTTANSYVLFGREIVTGVDVANFSGTVELPENVEHYIKITYDRDGGGSNLGQIVAKARRGHPECVRTMDTLTRDLTSQENYDVLQSWTGMGSDSGTITGDWVISDAFLSFDPNPALPITVSQSINLSQSQVFEQNEIITAAAIKRDLGGKSIIRDGGTSRVWVLGVDTTLDNTVALYTPSDGITWVSETITSNFAARGHAITIGLGGEPVVVLHKTGETDLEIWQRTGTDTWVKRATVSAGNQNDIDSFGIHYDGTTYHLIYMDKGGESVPVASRNRLRHRTSTNLTSWTSATNIDAGHSNGPYGNAKAMATAIDPSGDIHVVYGLSNSSGDQKLNYALYDGSWTTEEIEDFGVNFSNNDRLLYIDLAIDVNKKPHFIGIIEADVILGASNGFVNDDDFAAFYWEKTGASWTSALVLDVEDDTVSANYNPTLHFNNGSTPVAHWGSTTTAGAELMRAIKAGGGWTRARVGLVDQFGTDASNYDPDAAQYARTLGGHLVTGDFLYLRGSLIMIQSVATVWADGTILTESIPTFSQVTQLKGLPKPSTDFQMSQMIGFNFGFNRNAAQTPAFSTTVPQINFAYGRTDVRNPQLSQDIGHVFVPVGGGGDTFNLSVTENRLAFGLFLAFLLQQETIDNLTFSQSIGLVLDKTVPTPVELSQDVTLTKVKLLTADGDVLFTDVVFLNKELNLSVSHSLLFDNNGLPIRDWNAYSTAFDPGWGNEDDRIQVVFLHPASLPTTSLTMMRPDFGDIRQDTRRDGSVRRNRTGQPRTFKVPVYSTFVLNWTGIPRFVAEEFRTRIISYFGDELRYQDHNGVYHNVMITDTPLIRSQSNHEHVDLTLTLEKVNRVDLAPTIAG